MINSFKIVCLAVIVLMTTTLSSCFESKKGEPKKDLSHLIDNDEEDDLDKEDYGIKEGDEGEEGEEEDMSDSDDSMESESSDDDNEAKVVLSSSKETINESPSNNNSGWEYMVVVGSYIMESNAKNMQTNLKNKGFDNAEISVFDLSSYYTVNAGKFDSKDAAQNILNDFNAEFPELQGYLLKKR